MLDEVVNEKRLGRGSEVCRDLPLAYSESIVGQNKVQSDCEY